MGCRESDHPGPLTQGALMLSVTILICLILGICVESVQFSEIARRVLDFIPGASLRLLAP